MIRLQAESAPPQTDDYGSLKTVTITINQGNQFIGF